MAETELHLDTVEQGRLLRDEHGVPLERDYDELPATKKGRKPTLRESDAVNLAGQETGRQTLSHTRISSWLACERKFELHYLKRLELIAEPRGFTLGTAYQKAIEYQDPEVGVRYLNGFEPCPLCGGSGNDHYIEHMIIPCSNCQGRGYTGEQLHIYDPDAIGRHQANEAIVRGASALYLRRWPEGTGERREVEYRVRLRNPWTGAYSLTYDLLGYADGVIDNALQVPGDVVSTDPLEVIENKLVGRVESAKVQALPLDRQLALARYGLWRATGRPVSKVYYRWIKKPALKQRGGRKADKSDAESLAEFCQRIEADYQEREEFYLHEEEPSFVTARDLLRIEADLWEIAADMRAKTVRNGQDGRRRVFPRNTSHCTDYGGCAFIPICTGDPDANSLYRERPKRLIEVAPDATDHE